MKTKVKELIYRSIKRFDYEFDDAEETAQDLAKDICGLIPIRENDALRKLLWEQHPCKGKYGDDGERQCSRLPFIIDFKRDPIERIERYCAIHNCQRQKIAIPEFLLEKSDDQRSD